MILLLILGDEYLISRRSLFAKEPLIIWLLCRKWRIKIRHPMSLRHPVDEASLVVYPLHYPLSCQRAINYRALLRKMTYEDTASYESTPPCRWIFYGCLPIAWPLSCKKAIKNRALLRKTTYVDTASYESATPYAWSKSCCLLIVCPVVMSPARPYESCKNI